MTEITPADIDTAFLISFFETVPLSTPPFSPSEVGDDVGEIVGLLVGN